MQNVGNLSIFYNNVFNANKDVVMTLDYTAYDTNPQGGIIFGILPYYRVAPDGSSAGAGLGYSDDTTLSAAGMYDAQLGVGLDFSGYFATSATGTLGLSTIQPNSISIRGPASQQYPLLVTTGNLSSATSPFALYDTSGSAAAVKRVRVRLTDFGSRIIVDTKSSFNQDFTEQLNYSTSYNSTQYVRLYWGFTLGSNTTKIAVQNLNINGYDITSTMSYSYSGAWYLGLSSNPALLTENQFLSVVNSYPSISAAALSGISPLISISNASRGAPYVADNQSVSQRYSTYYIPSAYDSFIFVTYQ
jgi:hypothetical protein